MVYALIYCRRVYADILYHLYNIKLNRVEIVTYDRLYELLHTEFFVNLKCVEESGEVVILGIDIYLKNIGKNVNTCIKIKDGKYYCVDAIGRIGTITLRDYLAMGKRERSSFVNLEIKNKRLVADLQEVKVVKVKRNDVKIYINRVYIAFTVDDDCVFLVNSGYCDYYGLDLSIGRLIQKFYTTRNKELSYDGVSENVEFIFLKSVDDTKAITNKELLDVLTEGLKHSYQEFVQVDDSNKIYCLPIELEDDIKIRLKL